MYIYMYVNLAQVP